MNKRTWGTRWVPALGFCLLGMAGEAPAAVTMNGQVALDYYVSDTDAEGFELTSANLAVERIDNDGSTTSGPLSLSGWATTQPSPAGDGSEVGYDPLGRLPAHSSFVNVDDTVAADDLAPGEYYTHVLLQNDDFPGTYDDSRSLTPRLLWRGGLEAAGTLQLHPYGDGRHVTVDFLELRNSRIDSRYTNDIVLTLYATYGFGPASDGYTLCSVTVPGLYAGDVDTHPDFDCLINPIPNGDYTVHLEVAESGGRGGSSTLSGPDVTFRDDRFYEAGVGYCCGSGEVYYTGSLDALAIAPLLLALLWRLGGAPRARAVSPSSAGYYRSPSRGRRSRGR